MRMKRKIYMNKTIFICQLPEKYQNKIRRTLIENGINKTDIETALNSRLCDLEETLNEEVQSCFG